MAWSSSAAHREWKTTSRGRFSELEEAHRSVGGTGAGRRTRTTQVNHAYVLLLLAEFQRYCRNVQSEAADRLAVCTTADAVLRAIYLTALTSARQLDRANPTRRNLLLDYGRLGVDVRVGIAARVGDAEKDRLLRHLDTLVEVRNVIGHGAAEHPARAAGLARDGLRLADVRGWRGDTNRLARVIDQCLYDHLCVVTGAGW